MKGVESDLVHCLRVDERVGFLRRAALEIKKELHPLESLETARIEVLMRVVSELEIKLDELIELVCSRG
jgi:hypothetical protein